MRADRGLRSLRVRAPLPGHLPAASTTPTAFRHVLSLDGSGDDIWRRLHRNQVRRNIERTQRSDLRVDVIESRRALLGTFYPLHIATRRRLGVPVQPKRYFASLYDNVLEPGDGFALACYSGSRAVASAVFLVGGPVTVYKYGASDASAWSLRPNHALFWQAIQLAHDRDCRLFDFGRTGPEEQGLRQFKRWWGTTEIATRDTVLGEQSRAGLHHVPPVGAALLRHSPKFVTRYAGELLYRHAA